MIRPHKLTDQKGFTIVELMVALTVLSVLLLVATVTLTEIGRMYNKGVTEATVQDTDRNIVNDISGALAYGGTTPFSCTDQTTQVQTSSGNVNSSVTCAAGHTQVLWQGVQLDIYSYCIDTTRYSYVLDKQVVAASPTSNQLYHGLWRDTMTSNAACNPLDITKDPATGVPSDSASQPGSGSELIPLRMELTRFRVEEVQPTGSGLYTVGVTLAYGDMDLLSISSTDGSVQCNGDSGQEFCGVSNLDTVVDRRLQ